MDSDRSGQAGRLVEKAFWDTRHEAGTRETARKILRGRRLARVSRRIRSRLGAQPDESYAEFVSRRFLQAHLPVRSDWDLLEVGCAPGRYLLWFHHWFQYRPHGVEYSRLGAEQARDTLAHAGFDPQQIVEADFLSAAFQQQNAGRYDVVYSGGFIEHFDNPWEVVAAHVNMLKPSGILVCTVPNLLGPSYPFLRLCAREILDAHNCSLMRRKSFEKAFSNQGLTPIVCRYVGVFSPFGLTLRHEKSWRGRLAVLIDKGGVVVSEAMFGFLRGAAPEGPWSPYLVYIGQKVSG